MPPVRPLPAASLSTHSWLPSFRHPKPLPPRRLPPSSLCERRRSGCYRPPPPPSRYQSRRFPLHGSAHYPASFYPSSSNLGIDRRRSSCVANVQLPFYSPLYPFLSRWIHLDSGQLAWERVSWTSGETNVQDIVAAITPPPLLWKPDDDDVFEEASGQGSRHTFLDHRRAQCRYTLAHAHESGAQYRPVDPAPHSLPSTSSSGRAHREGDGK
ncbi:hypothetical protein IWX90DRAFT_411784 [Phyllosticta citrichinensis]|uniref:Uncharacterized protein n=1 Tax=Phyllosticta citrichinensis TaxID=1130410 RepID=A0ABR1Y201_9PEZI